MPPRRGGTTGDINNDPGRVKANYFRLSAFIPLLPYLEQSAIYNMIQQGGTSIDGTIAIAPGGPAGWYGGSLGTTSYLPWQTQVPGVICPSDNPTLGGVNGKNSYAFSLGDSMTNHNSDTVALRGAFSSPRVLRKYGSFSDGLSNTIAMSERVWSGNFGFRATGTDQVKRGTAQLASVNTFPGACLTTASGNYYTIATQVKGRFGALWTDGQAERVGFTTILGPNKPSCVNDANANADSNGGTLSASSFHTGGVSGVLMDGSVRFFSDAVDTGNVALPPVASGPSPYGVWGSLGSIDGGDQVSNLD